LRRAANREDAEGGESVAVPAREVLADVLFELKRSREALSAYRAVLKVAPNRFDALLGAARAADALGSLRRTPRDRKSKPPVRTC
jgi:hypothetical protein